MHWLKSSHLIRLHLHRQWFLNYDDCRANLCIADETWVGPRDLAQWKRPGTQIKALSFKGGQDCCPWHWWNAPGRGDNRWLFFAGSCSRWSFGRSWTSFVQIAPTAIMSMIGLSLTTKTFGLGNIKIQLSTGLQSHISILWMENHFASVIRNNALNVWPRRRLRGRDFQFDSLWEVNEANTLNRTKSCMIQFLFWQMDVNFPVLIILVVIKESLTHWLSNVMCVMIVHPCDMIHLPIHSRFVQIVVPFDWWVILTSLPETLHICPELSSDSMIDKSSQVITTSLSQYEHPVTESSSRHRFESWLA